MATCGFRRSCSQAALVPSSKVTNNVPRIPRMKSRKPYGAGRCRSPEIWKLRPTSFRAASRSLRAVRSIRTAKSSAESGFSPICWRRRSRASSELDVKSCDQSRGITMELVWSNADLRMQLHQEALQRPGSASVAFLPWRQFHHHLQFGITGDRCAQRLSRVGRKPRRHRARCHRPPTGGIAKKPRYLGASAERGQSERIATSSPPATV